MRLTALQIAAAATYTLSFLQISSAHPSKPVRFARHASHARDLSAQPAAGPISLRQHHEPRAVVDVCANVDTKVLSDLDLLKAPLSAVVGLNVCLCLSMLPLALTTDVQLETIVPLLGINNLTALLTAAIDGAPDSKHCTYPQHSKPLCSSSDPCGWECESPYVKEGDECVCQWPYTSCNGVCGSFTHGCGSSTPKARRSRTNLERRIETSMGVTTLAEAQKTCKEDETVCGVHAGSNLAYECINVRTNVESCGGCVFQNPFIAKGASAAAVDCSAIVGADKVSCVDARCNVSKCKDGWTISLKGDDCVKVNATIDISTLANTSASVDLLTDTATAIVVNASAAGVVQADVSATVLAPGVAQSGIVVNAAVSGVLIANGDADSNVLTARRLSKKKRGDEDVNIVTEVNVTLS